ncbi:GvpL/GvpF family gas vesicle protein [Halocatena pleomorpha]|uniref:GvpL/GvpF family gas vesicle protein n=1 Tax=Halocatena pleomorpha TaxID=1785090 RepID=A0A3P3RDM4_9EURY|nr:GvpL/GvpF family gas vesicle protein [Halocatena pleomorpha]RRJ31566.1 GvpL/GvpF family gas vesicle protein [Halocatena pleomorpha]
MSEEYLYAYGVIENEELGIDIEGVEGATRAYTVDHRTLSAITSDIHTMDPEETEENVRAHDEVLQTVMFWDEGRTVVPMQFGMTFKNERPLKNVLRGGRRAFTQALREMDGMVEFGVKLIVDEETTIDRDAVRESTTNRLATVSEQEAQNDLFSDRLVVNRSYLVNRNERSAFDSAVDTITDEYSDSVTVQYTGPWAPYNFVDIEISSQ